MDTFSINKRRNLIKMPCNRCLIKNYVKTFTKYSYKYIHEMSLKWHLYSHNFFIFQKLVAFHNYQETCGLPFHLNIFYFFYKFSFQAYLQSFGINISCVITSSSKTLCTFVVVAAVALDLIPLSFKWTFYELFGNFSAFFLHIFPSCFCLLQSFIILLYTWIDYMSVYVFKFFLGFLVLYCFVILGCLFLTSNAKKS